MMSGKRNFSEVIIHIGMPKTASTTLQHNFFANLSSINYLGPGKDLTIAPFLKQMFLLDSRYYQEEAYLQQLKAFFVEQRPLVISNENYAALPVPLANHPHLPREIVVKRMQSMFPKARILLIIRNQEQFLQSFFPQLIASSNGLLALSRITFQDYIDLNIQLVEQKRASVFQGIDYKAIIALYQKYFEKVEVVVFEEMIQDMKGFVVESLAPFLGVGKVEASSCFVNEQRNSRHGRVAIFLERQMEKGLSTLANNGNLHKKIPDKFRRYFMEQFHTITNAIHLGKIATDYTDAQLQFIQDYFSESNKTLEVQLGINLSQYDYPCGS